MPRATTAACEVMPPRVVRMPSAACMPWMSSGVVSTRTRMTLRPFFFALSASSDDEHDLARRRAGRGRQAGGDDLALGLRIDRRMQELVERRRIDAVRPPPSSRDQPLAREVDRDAQRRLAGALAVAGLQHPELALLDRELHVLHVAVVLLEDAVDAHELGIGLGHRAFHRAACSISRPGRAFSVMSCGVRMPATTSSPCALIRNSP